MSCFPFIHMEVSWEDQSSGWERDGEQWAAPETLAAGRQAEPRALALLGVRLCPTKTHRPGVGGAGGQASSVSIPAGCLF